MRRNITFLLGFLFLMNSCLYAQTDTTKVQKKKEKIKKGWTFGALPVVAYDADMGFQFGALAQLFDYGDGSTYPEYRHTLYVEVSRFTKGTGVNQLFYDSKYLIPGGIRVTADITYLTDRALNFFGFNGYEAEYHHAYENQDSPDSVYISRVFYRQQRKLLRVLADFQGPIIGNKLRWAAGLNFFDIKTGTVDVDLINRGKKESKKLPDTTLLYDDYVKYGIIKPEEKDGGRHLMLKFGLIFDTRDNEPAPNHGIWSEVLILTSPAFLGSTPYGFTKLAISHRQYFSIVPKYLVAAYRLSYQGTIGGTTPYYFQPYLITSYSLTTKPDGLGGSRTIRGVLLNRVVGDGVAYGNVELRWKFLKTFLFKQNFYLGLTGFFDAGMAVQYQPVDINMVPGDQTRYIDADYRTRDGLHMGWGIGLRAALNENFLIAIDYGFATDRRDGSSGLYVGIGNIF
jgi:hypothetical protein